MNHNWIRYAVTCALAATLLLSGVACQQSMARSAASGPAAGLSIEKASFGQLDGQPVDLYVLNNANGMVVKITNYGATITELWVPDRAGNVADVALGFDNIEQYQKESPYFGTIVGRYGNRIAKGKFSLNGQTYTLATNNDENHLHGGVEGFDNQLWNAYPIEKNDAVGLRLAYFSKDGEEGYPGNLVVNVTYWLNNDNELRIDYHALTDAPTVCNLTNHCYFNLAGQGNGDILDHVLLIKANEFTPVDKGLIPTGERRPVHGTPMDFTRPHRIGERVDADYRQIEYGLGYDHNWIFTSWCPKTMKKQVEVYEPTTGRLMEIHTREPGVQFYCGNFLDGTLTGKGGQVYKHRYGFCLETQHFPDSPNHPSFPSTELWPNDVYETSTIYKFLTR